MPELGRFARQLRWRLWKPSIDEEVGGELAFHLEMRVQELIARGMTPAAARAEALRRFGDVAAIDAACRDLGRRRDRDMRRVEWMSELGQDLRYAMRHLRSSPGFTLVAALTLALGIGASTTIFGVANAVLLRPFPYSDPERLVAVWESNPSTRYFAVSEPNYLDWREQSRSFAELGAFGRRSVSLAGADAPERLAASVVTPSLFRVLGVPAIAGRTFVAEEARPGAPARVVVLSNGLWQRRFGGDPGIVGGTISLDGSPHEIVGVMPASFDYPSDSDLWLPLAPAATSTRADRRLGVLARLRADITPAGALEDMRRVGRELARLHPASNAEWGVHLETLEDAVVGPDLSRRVLILLYAVGLLLLMACVNVANLMLARASVRQREMSLRAALGAGRGRIVRQLLTESVVLSLLGAALGVAFAVVAVPVLRDVGAEAIPRLDEMTVDWRVLAFGVGTALLTGMLFGSVPAAHASRADAHGLLRSGGRVAGAGRLRAALIVGSIAMAVLLLVGAGLVGGSFLRLMRVDPGFRAAGVLTASLSLPRDRYADAPVRAAFYAELLRRLATLPGVEHVGATNIAPFSGGDTGIPFTVVGRAPAGEDAYLSASWRSITPGYFAALGIPLKRGRVVAERDRAGAPRVAVISETMARTVWPNEDPVGKQILPQANRDAWTVIGVVGDIRDQALEQEPASMMYLSLDQVTWASVWVLVRTRGEPAALATAVRREVWAIDAALPVADVQPLTRLVDGVAAQPRLTMLIFGLFAAAALALAVVGVYGLVAYGVAQRTREIGVRLALGARPARIVRGVVGHGVRLAAMGIALGLAGAYALSRFLTSMLFEIQPTDGATYAGVALLLGGCAALASLLPARRASTLDPLLALRQE